MRRISQLLGLTFGLAVLAGAAPRAEAARLCTLACTHGFHCCVQGGTPTCVAPFQPCLPG